MMPGLPGQHPFPLALAAAAAAGVGSAPAKDGKQTADFPAFPFLRPPPVIFDQVTQTQQAILNMMRSHVTQQQQLMKKRGSDALDLSAADSHKRLKRASSSEISLCNLVTPCSHEAKEIKLWSVDDVCKFVASVDLCQPFVEVCM